MKVYITYQYDTPPCSVFDTKTGADKHIYEAQAGKLECQCEFVGEKEVFREPTPAQTNQPSKE